MTKENTLYKVVSIRSLENGGQESFQVLKKVAKGEWKPAVVDHQYIDTVIEIMSIDHDGYSDPFTLPKKSINQ